MASPRIGPNGAPLPEFKPVDPPAAKPVGTPTPGRLPEGVFTLPPRPPEIGGTGGAPSGVRAGTGGVSLSARPTGADSAPQSPALRRNLFMGEWATREVAGSLGSFNKFNTVAEGAQSVLNAPSGFLARAELFGSALLANVGLGPDMSAYAPPSTVVSPGKHYSVARYIATLAREHQSGNCGEKSMTAAVLLADRGIRPVEVFALAQGDHGFCVIGRDPDSNPADPTTWGPDAVVVDPWYNETYPASAIGSHMRNGGTTPSTERLYAVAD